MTRRGRRRLIFLFAVALIAAGSVFALREYRARAQARLEQQARIEGLERWSAGDYEAALAPLARSLTAEVDDREVLVAFADSRRRIPLPGGKHLREAAAAYEQALDIEPDDVETLRRLLGLYGRLGFPFEAVRTAERLLERSPDEVDALASLAALALRGEQEDRIATAVRDRVEPLIAGIGGDEVAAATFTRLGAGEGGDATLLTPPMARAWLVRGMAEALATIDPREPAWAALVLRAMDEGGATGPQLVAEARRWAERAPADLDARFDVLLAQVLLSEGRDEEAVAVATAALDRGAANGRVLSAVVRLLDELGREDDADRAIANARENHPDAAWPVAASIRRAWQRADFGEAESLLAAAGDRGLHGDLEIARWRALVATASGDRDRAAAAIDDLRAAADRTVEQASGDEREAARGRRDVGRAWADVLALRLDDDAPWTELVAAGERAVALAPDDPVLHFLVAEAYRSVGEDGLALRILEEVVERDRAWLVARMELAEVRIALGEPGAALADLLALTAERRLGLEPWRLLVRAWMAEDPRGTRVRLRGPDGTLLSRNDIVTDLAESRPDDARIQGMLARSLRLEGRDDELGILAARLQAREGAAPAVLLAVADELRRSGGARHVDDAVALVDRAESLGGDAAQVAVARAALAGGRGDVDAAIARLERALAAAEGDEARRDLAWRLAAVHVESGLDAGAAIDRLIELRPPAGEMLALLDLEATWRRPEVIAKLREHLDERLGDRSNRLELAEAAELAATTGTAGDAAAARAITIVRGVLDRDPDDVIALRLLAALLLEHVDAASGDAVRHLERLLELRPGDDAARRRLVRLLRVRGELDAARRTATAAAAGGDPAGIELAAELLAAIGDLEDAERRLARLDDAGLLEADGRVRRADLLRRLGRSDPARRTYESVLEDGPDPEALLGLATLVADERGLDAGLDLIDARWRADDGAGRRAARGRLLLASDRAEDAIPELEAAVAAALAADPDDAEVDVDRDLVGARMAAGDFAGAREAAERALERVPGDARLAALRDAAALALGEGDGGAVDPTLRELLRLDRLDPATPPSAADLAAARRLVEDRPLNPATWNTAITLHARAERFDEAIRLARRGAAALPAEPGVADLLVKLLLRTGRGDEARAAALDWRARIAAAPRPADVVLAAIALDDERPDDAITRLLPHRDRIVAASATAPADAMLLLTAAVAAGREDVARDVAARLVAASPPLATPAVRALATTEPERARRLLGSFAAPPFALASGWLEVARRSGDPADADRAAGFANAVAAAEVGPRRHAATLAMIDEAAGRLDDAERRYRDLLDADPDDVVVLNNLAMVLVRAGRSCGEAVRFAERARTLAPDVPGVIDTEVQALVCAGRAERAVEIATAALERTPGLPILRMATAEALLAAGRVAEARQAIDDLAEPEHPSDARRLAELRAALDARAAAGERP